MGNTTLNMEQGHWILAKMGKKVLRPGGKKLTTKLIENLKFTSEDDIVEFAPGLGFTASIALKSNPKTYTGIELNEEAAGILRKTINGNGKKIIIGNAAESTLQDNSSNKVYGEAMLTMQADHRKSEIIKEAYRILRKGGLYGIHELGLEPINIPEAEKAQIQRELSEVIKVNARPLTLHEWSDLLEKEGFVVINTETNAMSLLEIKRMIDDEGFFRTLKIGFNILTHAKARKKILAMRKVFRKYQHNLNAISIVAEKR
ncbi:MAG: class I SAM-dependent methyltransferase [Bacteroidetes bacterium]|nr:class I SAM-dependent methyltransferase [Bacteroidota bacterium]MBP7399016.1 class I SAM-dependent methyltransferase [Chitinophagales bacterium]MBK7107664.1 class I SAM-dependent methyltransferase [Bacteroidota bacterium]MBK8486905.1 class I SAM-dependent methyltransferase [Bacteroidota bacterium]MBK8681197.1 class I SAM-dependent methyltransferase [Bacteroidota bacterium]